MVKKISKNKGFTISELIMVFAIVIVVAILMQPFVRGSRRENEKVLCANNLRELGLALYIYARENEGKFPSTLKTLYGEEFLSDEEFLRCPAVRGREASGASDYIYTAGMTVMSPSVTPLVMDRAKNHEKWGKNILYVNGSVAWED